MGIRPMDMIIAEDGTVPATITQSVFLGNMYNCFVNIGGQEYRLQRSTLDSIGGKDYKINREGEFQMGILDVSLFGMQANLDGTYSFYGENMTANSKVYVNGEKQSTQFLNNTRIELKGIDLEEGDIIVVNQVGSSSRVFRSSVEYAYSQGNLVLASEYVPPVEVPEGAEGAVDGADGTDATVDAAGGTAEDVSGAGGTAE